jgi:DNA-binding IclR family transcriptional regulator
VLVAASLTGSGQKIYALLSSDEPRPLDDIVENTGLNSSDVLATLFDLEMKGFVRQLPGKLFSKVLFWRGGAFISRILRLGPQSISRLA